MKIIIPIPPKAQARDRIAVIGGRARSYKSKIQKVEEDKILTLLMAHKPAVPLIGAIKLAVKAYMPIPKSKSRKWREMAAEGKLRPTTKPDCSNLVKNLEDVMNEVYFHDDRQIVDLSISKFYGEAPRWEIDIEPLEAD